jgi:protein-S-isoprenylcysteine O-methyltransferase Ste14
MARWLARVPPLPFVLALLLAWRLHRLLPLGVPRGRTLGLAALGAGVALDGWSMATMARAGASPIPAEQTRALVESGPYRWSRNPIYVAHGLVTAGTGLAFWRTAWVLPATVAAWLATDRWTVPVEEARLANQWGESYEAYRRRVGRW